MSMVQINTNSPGLCPLGVLDPLNVPCTLSQLTWRFQPFRISFKQVRVCRSIFMLMLSLLFTFICMFTDFKERRDMWKMTFLDSQVLFSLIFAPGGRLTHESTLKTKYMTLGPNFFCWRKMTITRRRKHLNQLFRKKSKAQDIPHHLAVSKQDLKQFSKSDILGFAGGVLIATTIQRYNDTMIQRYNEYIHRIHT